MDPASKPDDNAAALAEALKFLGHDAREGHSSTLALLELQRIKPDPLTLPQLIERVEQNARRALAAIDDFMDLARARIDELRLEELDLVDLLVEAVADAWTIASRQGVRVLVAPGGPEQLFGQADRALLAGALTKLLRDAIAAAPRGAVLSCALREAPLDGRAGVVFELAAPVPAAPTEGGAAPRPARRAQRSAPGIAFAQVAAARHGGSMQLEIGADRRQTVRVHMPLTPAPDRPNA
jgi:hypothetical protein